MAQYPNLPGIEVSLADGGLILPDEGTTESMLIIGASTKRNAPAEPRLIRQSSDLVAQFGPFTDNNGNVNPIAAAWKAAFEGGNRRTYLLALQGVTEKEKFLNLHNLFFGILADFTVDNVVFKDLYSDVETGILISSDFTNPEDIENFPNVAGVAKYAYVVTATSAASASTTVTVSTNDSFIIKTNSEIPITITASAYPSIEELALAVETAITGASGLENFRVIVEGGKLQILGDKAFTYKAGAKGDASASLKLEADTEAVKIRHEYGPIYVGNFAELLKDYCEDQTINHNTVKGFLGVKSPLDYTLTSIKAYVDALSDADNEYSGHVSVVAGPELAYQIPGKASVYYANGVITYAALVSNLPAESAPTNKAIAGAAGIGYNLSLRQLNALSGNKFVSFRLKNGQIYVTDGITTAPDLNIGGVMQRSDFTRLSTVRIVHAAINLVRTIADPFVGEPAGVPQKNALHAAIKSGLERMKEAGAIQNYRFTIVQERGAGVLGQSRITLQLVPAYETKKIAVDVSLTSLLSDTEE